MTVQPSEETHQFPALSYAQALSDPKDFIEKLRDALLTVGFFNLIVSFRPLMSS